MIYQGSKKRILKDILPFIQNCIDENKAKNYYELFVGGANVIDSVKCENKYGYDLNGELVELLRYMRDNPKLEIFPQDCDFNHYSEVREDRKSGAKKFFVPYIAGIGYFASYGGRYFDGGYGKDPSGKRNIYKERLKFAREQAPQLKGIEFNRASWEEFNPSDFSGCVFYLDPPYRDSKEYNGKGGFDYEKFYDFCRDLGKRNWVFISEYNMPSDFQCVWSKEVKVMQKADRKEADLRVEKLFYVGKDGITGLSKEVPLFEM